MSETFKWCQDKSRLNICDKQVFYIDEFGIKTWHMNGKFHRENGPAIEYVDGDKSWYLNGKYYKESAYWKELRK